MTKSKLPSIPWDRIHKAAKEGNPIAKEIIALWNESFVLIRKEHEERLQRLIRSGR